MAAECERAEGARRLVAAVRDNLEAWQKDYRHATACRDLEDLVVDAGGVREMLLRSVAAWQHKVRAGLLPFEQESSDGFLEVCRDWRRLAARLDGLAQDLENAGYHVDGVADLRLQLHETDKLLADWRPPRWLAPSAAFYAALTPVAIAGLREAMRQPAPPVPEGVPVVKIGSLDDFRKARAKA